ncbi:MAG: KH domain-containing protein [Lachnospiraceae bacterium]|nr:KH domain-containing protein [Lachnospiraceae bacterium]
MKEVVEVIAKALVEHPEEVSVEQTETDHSIDITLKVAEGDIGKVIGKQGRIAKAIRSVVKAAASKDSRKVNVDIV